MTALRASAIAKPRAERREHGAYFTPDALALAICRSLADEIVTPIDIFEPGCGGGAFLRAAHATWPSAGLEAIDLEPQCKGPGCVYRGDVLSVRAPTKGWALIVGNPDFLHAEEIVRHCLTLLAPDGHLAFLLPLSFLGGTGRAALYREHPLRYLQPIAGRPSFTGGSTGSQEYAVFVWQRLYGHANSILPPLTWKP